MTYILDVVLAELDPLPGREDGVQDVLAAGLGVHRWQLLLLRSYHTEKERSEY